MQCDRTYQPGIRAASKSISFNIIGRVHPMVNFPSGNEFFTFEFGHNYDEFRYCTIMRILILLQILYNLNLESAISNLNSHAVGPLRGTVHVYSTPYMYGRSHTRTRFEVRVLYTCRNPTVPVHNGIWDTGAMRYRMCVTSLDVRLRGINSPCCSAWRLLAINHLP
jgi:hypothetical protein